MVELLSGERIVDYLVAVERVCIHEASDYEMCANERGKITWFVLMLLSVVGVAYDRCLIVVG